MLVTSDIPSVSRSLSVCLVLRHLNYQLQKNINNDDGVQHAIKIIIHEGLALDSRTMYAEPSLLVFHREFGSSSPKRRYFCGRGQFVAVSCTRAQTLDSTEHVRRG
jgi:hypothetical protein